MWREAVDVAVAEKDAEALQTIRSRCRDKSIQNIIDRLLAAPLTGAK